MSLERRLHYRKRLLSQTKLEGEKTMATKKTPVKSAKSPNAKKLERKEQPVVRNLVARW
jgi:hypothetical protein